MSYVRYQRDGYYGVADGWYYSDFYEIIDWIWDDLVIPESMPERYDGISLRIEVTKRLIELGLIMEEEYEQWREG